MIDFEALISGGHSDSSQIRMGSVGWEGEDDYMFLGSDENDGHTLIRVQLFDGRDTTKPINPNRAQGHKIVCHLSGGIYRVPKKDTRVLVACPKGMEDVVGASVLLATIEPSPTLQFADDRAVMDYGPDVHVVIRAKSVSIQSYEDEFISVGEPRSGGTSGIFLQAKDGSGGVVQEGVVGLFVAEDGEAKTLLQMEPSKVSCFVKSGGYWVADTSGFVAGGNNVALKGGAVYLGRVPTAASPARYGTTVPVSLISTSVFISP